MMYTSLLRTGVLLVTLVYGFSYNISAKQVLAADLEMSKKSATAGIKEPFVIKRGDCELTFGGKLKIENKFFNDMTLFNNKIPDQAMFFKQGINLNADLVYGKEKFGYKAVELFADLQYKGIWARGTRYADRNSDPTGPALVKVSQSYVGTHDHVTGKSMPWFDEAWLQFSPNAAIGHDDTCLHTIKLGWFPFVLGRGIALGAVYGVNKQFLGINTYGEDKGTPGIDLHGVLIKNYLEYDLYYTRLESRSTNFQDNIAFDRLQIVNRATTPFRGVSKDNDLFAARLQWKVLNSDRFGVVDLEPYIFYNAASDQQVEIPVDSKSNWGSYGLSLEHTRGNFECGGEVAFNYGGEDVFAIDRNVTKIVAVNGQLVEQFSKIYGSNPSVKGATLALATPLNLGYEQTQSFAGDITKLNGAQIIATNINTGATNQMSGLYSAFDRFRPSYKDKFRGWMGVVDGAYTFEDWNLKIAAAYGYATGDLDPRDPSRQFNKTYNAFIGLHEVYDGKRVPSVIMMGERWLKRPLPLAANETNKLSDDISFSNLQHVGLGVKWTPRSGIKKLCVNPNILGFWATKESQRFIVDTSLSTGGTISPTDRARNFLGTEFNIVSSCAAFQDLKIFASLALFVPGGYFADMKGLKLNDAYYKLLNAVAPDVENEYNEELDFTLGNSNAFYMNIGVEYKF